VVIDEVQRRPELFPILRVLADRDPMPARFLVLGSASGALLRQSSESLAGRVERITISGFTVQELGADAIDRLWVRGGLPRSCRAGSDEDSAAWRADYIRTLLEQDLPTWGARVPASALRRFWTMLAHYHGQVWNAADPARALGVSEPTVRRHLDLLTDAFMIRQLQPYYANIGKRQIKAPKIYVRDSGLLHQLLGIESMSDLVGHPKLGASWEGFAMEQVLANEPHHDAFYWGTHQGAEIDLVLQRGGRLFGVEFKRADAPRLTPSIRYALDDLKLERIVIVYPGDRSYRLSDRVHVVPLRTLASRGSLFAGDDPGADAEG